MRHEPARRWEAVPVALLALLLGRTAADRLLLREAVLSEPAAAVAGVPPAWFWWPVAAGTLALFLLATHAAIATGPAWRVRAFYVFGALALAVWIFVLPSARLPGALSLDSVGGLVVDVVAERLAHAHEDGKLLADPGIVEASVRDVGPPPYRRYGVPVEAWAISVQVGCEGPPTEAGAHDVGTLLYCVTSDRARGWLTFVGTGGREAGPPALGRHADSTLVVAEVRPAER